MLCPEPLKPGAAVRVIAPSGPFDRTLFYRALGWLSGRYRVRWSSSILARTGFLAGDDSRRLQELDGALQDPTLGAIVAARGGYGASRICHLADFSGLQRHPKWLVGFSDFTALHLEASRVEVCSLHAANLGALGRGDEAARRSWLAALEQPLAVRRWGGLTVLQSGSADGPVVGGNLSLLASHAASARLRLRRGSILFIEEVNEAPYRIDRMLTSLLVAGHLDALAGICVGQLEGCGGHAAPTALDVIAERTHALGIPVLAGLPIGHGQPNEPLVLGARARLSSNPAELVLSAAP